MSTRRCHWCGEQSYFHDNGCDYDGCDTALVVRCACMRLLGMRIFLISICQMATGLFNEGSPHQSKHSVCQWQTMVITRSSTVLCRLKHACMHQLRTSTSCRSKIDRQNLHTTSGECPTLSRTMAGKQNSGILRSCAASPCVGNTCV